MLVIIFDMERKTTFGFSQSSLRHLYRINNQRKVVLKERKEKSMKKPSRHENKTTNQGRHYQTKSYLCIVLWRGFNSDIFQETTKGMLSGWS